MRFKPGILILVLLITSGFSALYGNQNILTPQLQQKLQECTQDELIPVNIVMKEQYDPQYLLQQSTFFPLSERRDLVIQELKSFADIYQQDLLYDLQNLSYNDIVKDIQSLWVSNVIACKATPEVIYNLTQRDDVDFIDYDEIRNVLMFEKGNTYNPTSREITWNVTKVNADDVWNLGYTGSGVVVAVIDTGVNYNHLDLADHLWTDPAYPNHGWDFRFNDNNPMDDHGHGTHCSGTVAGDGTAGSQTGMAPDAQIMCLKVLDSDGSGSESNVWNAIQFAITNGADVVSMSLGWLHAWSPNRITWRNTMNTLLAAGIPASVAAGNEGDQQYSYPIPDNVRTPGDCPPPWLHPDQTLIGGISSVICIGATNSGDGIANFSGRGPCTWEYISGFNDYPYSPEIGLIRPDIVAPGVNIKSLAHYSNTGYESGWNGTSMATPCAAGVMALMLSKNPNILPAQIDQILEETAYVLSTSKSNTFGSGRVDALAAINQVPSPSPIMNFYPDSLDFGDVQIGDELTQQFYVENVGGDTLRGTINAPDGYTVALHGSDDLGRNTLEYAVSCGSCNVYDLTFSPTSVQNYDDLVRINQIPFYMFYLDVYGEGCPEVGIDQTPHTQMFIEHYPNPVTSTLSIHYSLNNQQDAVQISIYNIKGEYITTIQGHKGTASMDVSSLHDGVYFYKVDHQGISYSNKFIILK
ncbi:MAG: S8 family serine peptidase [Candidatus Cloacimonetes bacterium]|nr:S8 family serine peptidase [Candidatus Cloacimonadota bacterium]